MCTLHYIHTYIHGVLFHFIECPIAKLQHDVTTASLTTAICCYLLKYLWTSSLIINIPLAPGAVSLDMLYNASLRITLTVPEVVGRY